MEAVFERIGKDWGKLDFAVHSIAFSPKDTLQGRVVDVPREGFLDHHGRVLLVVHPHGASGGTADAQGRHAVHRCVYGSQMVVKNYNIMGVAKAALESAVRYIAADWARRASVSTPSPGPLATSAASGIPGIRRLTRKGEGESARRSLVSIEDVGVATAFLAHDAARLITGETLYIDGGYHIMDYGAPKQNRVIRGADLTWRPLAEIGNTFSK